MTTDTDLKYDVDDVESAELEADDDAYGVYRSISKAAVGVAVAAAVWADRPDVSRRC